MNHTDYGLPIRMVFFFFNCKLLFFNYIFNLLCSVIIYLICFVGRTTTNNGPRATKKMKGPRVAIQWQQRRTTNQAKHPQRKEEKEQANKKKKATQENE